MKYKMLRWAPTTIFCWYTIISPAFAEDVYVKYRGYVLLDAFYCEDITDSSFVERVCYDSSNEYMLISLTGTYYHYCGIDADTVDELIGASSKGRYFNQYIKGDPSFDCRLNSPPDY